LKPSVRRRGCHAEGVFVESRGCRRFADTPGRNDQRAQRRRRFRGINPASSHATSSRRHARSHGDPFGVGVFVAVTGGCGETPQPPALDANRFAIGKAVGRRVRHAEGVFVESRVCRRFACTPGQDDQRTQRRRGYRGINPAPSHATSSRRHARSHGDPFGVGVFVAVTGGCGETPQPPALNGNRFAIDDLTIGRATWPSVAGTA
jgi:hypothetical protein